MNAVIWSAKAASVSLFCSNETSQKTALLILSFGVGSSTTWSETGPEFCFIWSFYQKTQSFLKEPATETVSLDLWLQIWLYFIEKKKKDLIILQIS